VLNPSGDFRIDFGAKANIPHALFWRSAVVIALSWNYDFNAIPR
jgi:carbamoylphosphate synthase small subunit